jgi:hypothetical protein
MFMKCFGHGVLAVLRRLVVGQVPLRAPAPRDWRGRRVISPPQAKRHDFFDTLKPGDLRMTVDRSQ